MPKFLVVLQELKPAVGLKSTQAWGCLIPMLPDQNIGFRVAPKGSAIFEKVLLIIKIIPKHSIGLFILKVKFS